MEAELFKYGPVGLAFALLLGALITVFKAYVASQSARIADAKEMAEAYKDVVSQQAASVDVLTQALRDRGALSTGTGRHRKIED